MRVGLFGLLGSGNIGNDGSLEALLAYLRDRHPDAELGAFCAGPERVTTRYGIPAVRLNWHRAEYRTASGLGAVVLKGFGKIVDAFRTAAWVRRHDVVIVPGMGVLETTLPLRPWGWPYSLLLLSLSGKVFGTKVVLLSVGAERIENRVIRALVLRAARLATYRSYRDELSRDAMSAMGLDTRADGVFPDLVFGLPTPVSTSEGIVGVGVMAYRGGNEDRDRAEEIYRDYVAKMTLFVRRLVASGRRVRLFVGDRVDEPVASRIVSEIGSPLVSAASVSTLDELMAAMAPVDAVVATRYHNVLCALRLAKPTVSVGYAAKNDVLMADMGLGEFCQSAKAIDVDRLVSRFTALEERAAELRLTLAERNHLMTQRIEQQLTELSSTVLELRTPQEVG